MNKDYSNKNFISTLSQSWKNGKDLKEKNVEFYGSPFKLAVVENFFEKENLTTNLLHDILEVDWIKKQMDLYHFRQSDDISKLNAQYLKEFLKLLEDEVKPWIETICDVKINRVSASCSMYNNGDFLLVHDDLCSNRQIAYVFYISPFDKNVWTKDMGGALEIFNVDSDGFPDFPAIRHISPINNQFVFFKVGALSFHQVEEVKNLDYPRLTINGWFYGDVNKDLKSFVKPKITNYYKNPNTLDINLSEWINSVYLERKTKTKIQSCIEMKSEISLEDFLIPNVFNDICKHLENPKLKWMKRGPASSSHYEVLDILTTDGLLQKFIEIFSSTEMFKLLFEYTALDFYGKNSKNPTCFFEFQRLNKGSYTLLFDDSFSEDCKLNLFIYFNSIDNVGTVTYLSRDSDGSYEEIKSDSALLTVYPQDNSLNIIYCTDDQTHFTNYISKVNNNLTKPVHRLYCTYKE
ncbi:prolyl 3-hydroxylase sudestada1 [Condylostylus longicornis]|uniref:prolyl 3-hydroxylase sudestada1 n=1 Tax=Condylostylus longicornis TaxID=2530218 RepID=UPI00244DA3A8|nr:prolyl 3-hydroxylase sudestada1 [Condylostylus longicornis]